MSLIRFARMCEAIEPYTIPAQSNLTFTSLWKPKYPGKYMIKMAFECLDSGSINQPLILGPTKSWEYLKVE